ncbi:glucosamine-6-phosphate deaminase [Sediminibacillus albus]|uniref:Glucosamine-6-phosphate deaminase n=1 Tax=Sediminibacillus albus TaxID=407036 RepID=A0A1G8YNT1_9BACI|nr:glucosamine-6-phosphate deaminase [Sediminibacillus albus]SDK03700.1 glucosamine-6-phosphate deaminase [Sediminibacillus albus]
MKIEQVENYQEMSKYACDAIIDKVNSLQNPVLGLATGSTPEGVYNYLREENRNNRVTFRDTCTFNLDEYVGLAGDNPNSYRYYMNDRLFNHIDIPKQQTFIPNGKATDLSKECREYEQLLEDNQEIDLQILGLGLNGHIGFNEPGTSFKTRTHVVDLALSTREANARFFDSIEEVPNQAITMGIETIMNSKQILLLVSGERKAKALDQLLHGEVSEEFPASILKTHDNVKIIADKAALSKVRV